MGNIQKKIISFFREKILPVFSKSEVEDEFEDVEDEEDEEEERKKNKKKWKSEKLKRKRDKRKKRIAGSKKIILTTDEDEIIVTDERSLRLLCQDISKASQFLENRRDETSYPSSKSSEKKLEEYLSLKENSKQKKIDKVCNDEFLRKDKAKKFSSDQKISNKIDNKIFEVESTLDKEIKYRSFNKNSSNEKVSRQPITKIFTSKTVNQEKISATQSEISRSNNEISENKQMKNQRNFINLNLVKSKYIESDFYREKSGNECNSNIYKKVNNDSLSESESEEDDASSFKRLLLNKRGESSKTKTTGENNNKKTQNFEDKQSITKFNNNRTTNHRKIKPRMKILKQNWRYFSDIDEEEEEKFDEEKNKEIRKAGKHGIRNELNHKEKDWDIMNKQGENILEESNINNTETRNNSLIKVHLEKISVKKLPEMFNKGKINKKEEANNNTSKREDISESFSKEKDEGNTFNNKQNEENTSDFTDSVNALFKNTSEKLISLLGISKDKINKADEDCDISKDTGNELILSIEENQVFNENNDKNQIAKSAINSKETHKIETEWSKDFRDVIEMTFKNILERLNQKEKRKEEKIRDIKADDKIPLIQYHSDYIQMDGETLTNNATVKENIKTTVNDNWQEHSHNKMQISDKHKLLTKYLSKNSSEKAKQKNNDDLKLKDEGKNFSENDNLKIIIVNKNIQREVKGNILQVTEEEWKNISEEHTFEKFKNFKTKVNTKDHVKSIPAREDGVICEKDVASLLKQKLFLLKKDNSSKSRSILHKKGNYQILGNTSSSSDDEEILNVDNNSSNKIISTSHLSSNTKKINSCKEKEKDKPKLPKISKYKLFKANVDNDNDSDSDKTSEESSGECANIDKRTTLTFLKKSSNEDHENNSLHEDKHIVRKISQSKTAPDRGWAKSLTSFNPWRRFEENENVEDEEDYNHSNEDSHNDLQYGLLTPSNKIIEKLIKKKANSKLNKDEEELLELYIQNKSRRERFEEIEKVSEMKQKSNFLGRNKKFRSNYDNEDPLVEKFSAEAKAKSKTESKQKILRKLYHRDTSSDDSEEEDETTTKKGKHKVLVTKDSEVVKNKTRHKPLMLRFKKSSENSEEEESIESCDEKGLISSTEECLRLLIKFNFHKAKGKMKGESSESEDTEEVSKFSKLRNMKLSKFILKEEEKPVKRGVFGRKVKQKKKSRFQRVITGKTSKKKKKRRTKRKMCLKVTKMAFQNASETMNILGDQPIKMKSVVPVKRTNKIKTAKQKETLGKKSKYETLNSKKTQNSKSKPKSQKRIKKSTQIKSKK
ncbi:UNVERIFIED_CONTAM: hypothetical protein RMT77_007982 [Armadillidium vulgare]